MSQPWTCPVCKAGVAPWAARCDHGGIGAAPLPDPLTIPAPNPPWWPWPYTAPDTTPGTPPGYGEVIVTCEGMPDTGSTNTTAGLVIS